MHIIFGIWSFLLYRDRFCGKLYCEGGAGFPVLGTLASAQQVTIGGHSCKAASVDQGQDVPDPGYVANGSPCGDGMVSGQIRGGQLA